MPSFLCEFRCNGRVSHYIADEAHTRKWNETLGAARVLWRIPDALEGCSIVQALEAYRLHREYNMGVSA